MAKHSSSRASSFSARHAGIINWHKLWFFDLIKKKRARVHLYHEQFGQMQNFHSKFHCWSKMFPLVISGVRNFASHREQFTRGRKLTTEYFEKWTFGGLFSSSQSVSLRRENRLNGVSLTPLKKVWKFSAVLLILEGIRENTPFSVNANPFVLKSQETPHPFFFLYFQRKEKLWKKICINGSNTFFSRNFCYCAVEGDFTFKTVFFFLKITWNASESAGARFIEFKFFLEMKFLFYGVAGQELILRPCCVISLLLLSGSSVTRLNIIIHFIWLYCLLHFDTRS